jgi:hypothetical protein
MQLHTTRSSVGACVPRTWLRTTRRGVSTIEREALPLVQAERARRAAIAKGRRALARAVLRATGFDDALARIAGRTTSHRGRIVDNEAATLNATHATHIRTPLHNVPITTESCCRKHGRNMTPSSLSTPATHGGIGVRLRSCRESSNWYALTFQERKCPPQSNQGQCASRSKFGRQLDRISAGLVDRDCYRIRAPTRLTSISIDSFER